MAKEDKFSLFGLETPEEVRRRIGRTSFEEGATLASLPRGRGGVALAGRLPGLLNNIFDFTGEQAKAKRQQEILQKTMQEAGGESRIAFYKKLAENMKDENPQMSLQALEAARKLEAAATPEIGPVNPDDWTPESLQKFSQTRNYDDLVAVPKKALLEQNLFEKGYGAGNTELEKTMGKEAAQYYTASRDRAREARDLNAKLDRIALSLAKGTPTGKGAAWLLDTQSFLRTLTGWDIGDIKQMSEQEVIRTINSELSLILRNPESGLGLTGNTSNRDLQFLQSAVPGIDRTPEGNKLIIKFIKKKNQFNIDQAKYLRKLMKEYRDKKIPIDTLEIEDKLDKFAEEYQFVTPEERKQIDDLLNAHPAMSDEEYNSRLEAARKSINE